MSLQNRIMQRLSRVVAPETGLGILRMGLVRDFVVDEQTGDVHLIFRPSSFLCPMTFKLAVDIKDAIKGIAGVNSLRITVEDFARARELNHLLAVD